MILLGLLLDTQITNKRVKNLNENCVLFIYMYTVFHYLPFCFGKLQEADSFADWFQTGYVG